MVRFSELEFVKSTILTVLRIHHTVHLQVPSVVGEDPHILPAVWVLTVDRQKEFDVTFGFFNCLI